MLKLAISTRFSHSKKSDESKSGSRRACPDNPVPPATARGQFISDSPVTAGALSGMTPYAAISNVQYAMHF